uniref:CSON014185 protein n=1 Tax=Culicoides sonorensis TaxID=179676 RepID=A0A336KQW7_CULSO
MWLNSGDRDSGRGSPTGSINSAIVRRKRHKASKNSFAWMTHGQTIHPKSQKTNIERLMKLILEQGEIIQQQLAKLRDREVEINNIEDERHKLREKEHGKNYLLETYLKGLQDSAEEKESGVGNSDSGVHTEEVTTSPEIAPSPLYDEDNGHQTNSNILHTEPKEKRNSNSNNNSSSNKNRSRRETELRIEHETIVKNLKELSMKEEIDEEEEQGAMALPPETSKISQEIEVLEKIVNINKQLQKEEELLVRLGAKIKRYEADATGLSEQQVLEALERVNKTLEINDDQLGKMDLEIKESDKLLEEKSSVLKKLYDELEEVEVEHNRLNANSQRIELDLDFNALAITSESDMNLSREYLAENMYNVSKTIYSGGSEFNAAEFSPTSDINDMFVHPIDPPSEFCTPLTPTLAHAQIHSIKDKTPKFPSIDDMIPKTPITDSLLHHSPQPSQILQQQQQQQHRLITSNKSPSINLHNNNKDLLSQMNYLPATLNKYHQRNINNVMTTATSLKVGPKKLINGVVMHDVSMINNTSSATSNSSDTGMSSLGEQDFTQLGTLV